MNHLIIGLGATGAQVLAELRRRLVLRHGQVQPEGFDVRLALLSQDAADVRPDSAMWAVAGLSTRLPQDQMLVVKPATQAPVETQIACRQWIESQVGAASTMALSCHVVGHLGSRPESGLMSGVVRLLRPLPQVVASEVIAYGLVPAGSTQGEAAASRTVLRDLQGLMGAESQPGQAALARFDTGYLWHEAAEGEEGISASRVAGVAEFLYQRLYAGHSLGVHEGRGMVGVGVQRLGPDIDTWQEHLGLEIALRALSELSVGDGGDTAGSGESAGASAQTGVVRVDPEQRGRMVSGDPLHLKVASIVAAGTFETTWNEYAEHFHRLARQAPEEDRLGQLTLLFDQALQSGFRGKGLDAYFHEAAESEELTRFTEERLADIQTELMQQWLGGQCSLRASEHKLQSMVSELHFYIDQLEQTVRQRVEVAEHHGLQVAGLTQSARHLAGQPKGGFFGRKDRDRELTQLLDNAVVLWRERALSMTQVVAGRFAQQQAERLIIRLNELFHLFESIQQALDSMQHEWRGRAEQVNARRRSDQLRERLLTREALSRLDFKALIASWLDTAAPGFSLRAMASMTQGCSMSQKLLRLSGQAAREFIAVQAAPSLIDSLAQRWMAHQAQQDQALQTLFQGVGIGEFPLGQAASTRWQLLMPAAELKANHLQTFVDALERLFRLKGALAEIGDWARIDCHGAEMAMPSDQRLTLIGLVPLPQWGRPAQRPATAVATVAATAQVIAPDTAAPLAASPPPAARIPSDSAHCEKDSPAWIPQARCILLLAEAAGLVRQGIDPVSGVSRLLWPQVDEDGFDLEPRVLGADIPDAITRVSREEFEVLRQALQVPEVSARLHAADRQEVIRQSMRSRIEAIRSAAPASELDAVSLAWSQAARAAMRFVRQEAML